MESISVFIIIFFSFFPQCDILDIDASGWLNMIKQIKQAQPVRDMENSGHCAYCKLLKVKHKNGFEGYLILTGARSQLTTLIKPQYIALHMSRNPRFQNYSKLEWCFLRCWRAVTHPFLPNSSPSTKLLFIYLFCLTCWKVTKSARCSAASNLKMWHKCDISPTKPLFYKPLKAYWNTFLTQSEREIFWTHGHILACGSLKLRILTIV